MPQNCMCVKNKLIFKIKHNGVYWAHQVACWYSQVYGSDFPRDIYCEWNKVEKHTIVPVSYEGLDDKTVLSQWKQ